MLQAVDFVYIVGQNGVLITSCMALDTAWSPSYDDCARVEVGPYSLFPLLLQAVH